ncbi:MAG: hypothetical protein QY326_08645 [Bdellovibrionota bacterium]|nr:MAG: hypothetical protein QY326_08645 [Bdellovibrionota bacterium]
MSERTPQKVLLVCADLMFRMELKDALRARGWEVIAPKNVNELPPEIDLQQCARVLVDLESTGEASNPLLQRLAEAPEKVLCFFSHRNVEALTRAQECGLEQIVPRSALQRSLDDFLT